MRVIFERETVQVEADGDQATVWLSRASSENAINVQMLSDLKDTLDFLEDEATVPDVIIFRGRGGNLTRGIDLTDFPRNSAPDIHGFNKWERVLHRVEKLYKATICAIEGKAFGGGLHLALVCDLRFAQHNVEIALPEVRSGFLPGMATWRLGKFVGLGIARRMVLTGDAIDGLEASALGLVDRVVIEGDFGEELNAYVSTLLPIKEPAWTLARRLLNEAYEFSHEHALGHLLAAQHRAITSDVFLSGYVGRDSD